MITSMNESINLNEDSLLEERIAQETEESVSWLVGYIFSVHLNIV